MTSTTANKDIGFTVGAVGAIRSSPVEVTSIRAATAQDAMPEGLSGTYVVGFDPSATPNRERAAKGALARGDLRDVSRYLRRMSEQLAIAMEEDRDDVVARDAAIRDVLPLWGLAFEHRSGLKEPLRDLLSHILTCVSSPLAAQNDVALHQLHTVVSLVSQHLGGATEKDVDGWTTRLEEAGFDLAAPITAPTSDDDTEAEDREG